MQSFGNDHNNILMSRLILLWILIEVVLGGALHALKIPLSGLIVGNFAIVCIFLIMKSSENCTNVFKALMTVMLAKLLLSPQASPFAYIAMIMQTLCMLPICLRKNSRGLRFLCVCISSLYSPFQKIITLYLILGGAAIFDVYVLADRWLGMEGFAYGTTLVLVGLYLLVYVVGAVLTVSIVNRFSEGIRVNNKLLEEWNRYNEPDNEGDYQLLPDNHKWWFKRIASTIIVLVLLGLWVFYPEASSSWLLRFGILAVLYLVIIKSLRWVSRYYQGVHYESMLRIEQELPRFRKMIAFCRIHSKLGLDFPSIKAFVVALIHLYLNSPTPKYGLPSEPAR
jgi:hypothetical protein